MEPVGGGDQGMLRLELNRQPKIHDEFVFGNRSKVVSRRALPQDWGILKHGIDHFAIQDRDYDLPTRKMNQSIRLNLHHPPLPCFRSPISFYWALASEPSSC
jgi:hypothetical protein